MLVAGRWVQNHQLQWKRAKERQSGQRVELGTGGNPTCVASILTISRFRDVQATVLHEDMNCTENVTIYCETSCLINRKSYIVTLSWTQGDSTVEVMCNGEPMGLRRIIVHHMNRHRVPCRNVHHWPRSRLILAAVESNVHPFISHYDPEVGDVGLAGGNTSAGGGPKPEEMKRVRCRDRSRPSNGNS